MGVGQKVMSSSGVVIIAVLLLVQGQGGRASSQVQNNVSNLLSWGAKEIVSSGGCNLFRGRWVVDSSYPLYQPSSCPFIDSEFDCIKYGRPDKQYLKYAWKPDSCDLPRFDGGELLKRWRGKKVMFVGDSLSLNMWNSLACMIHASVPTAKITYSRQETLSYSHMLPLRWDYVQDGPKVNKDMDRLLAFYKGLTTWARWVDQNVDSSKTKVFFQGISPTHYMGNEWKSSSTKNCNGEQLPLEGAKYPAGTPEAAVVVNKVLSRITKPVTLLDITFLSQLRKDAHPSMYGGGGDHSGVDCSHWCLPGLPDTWNHLLYASVTMSAQNQNAANTGLLRHVPDGRRGLSRSWNLLLCAAFISFSHIDPQLNPDIFVAAERSRGRDIWDNVGFVADTQEMEVWSGVIVSVLEVVVACFGACGLPFSSPTLANRLGSEKRQVPANLEADSALKASWVAWQFPRPIIPLNHSLILLNPPIPRNAILLLQIVQQLINQRNITIHYELKPIQKSNAFCSGDSVQFHSDIGVADQRSGRRHLRDDVGDVADAQEMEVRRGIVSALEVVVAGSGAGVHESGDRKRFSVACFVGSVCGYVDCV
nr:protein trichome birefringence-like 38 [Ipomoea batatas]